MYTKDKLIQELKEAGYDVIQRGENEEREGIYKDNMFMEYWRGGVDSAGNITVIWGKKHKTIRLLLESLAESFVRATKQKEATFYFNMLRGKFKPVIDFVFENFKCWEVHIDTSFESISCHEGTIRFKDINYSTSSYFSKTIPEIEELVIKLKAIKEVYAKFVENSKPELEQLNKLLADRNLNQHTLTTHIHKEK